MARDRVAMDKAVRVAKAVSARVAMGKVPDKAVASTVATG
jgi:hypothetical protein